MDDHEVNDAAGIDIPVDGSPTVVGLAGANPHNLDPYDIPAATNFDLAIVQQAVAGLGPGEIASSHGITRPAAARHLARLAPAIDAERARLNNVVATSLVRMKLLLENAVSVYRDALTQPGHPRAFDAARDIMNRFAPAKTVVETTTTHTLDPALQQELTTTLRGINRARGQTIDIDSSPHVMVGEEALPSFED